MTKQAIPLFADDITHFSRALSQQLNAETGVPSHLSLMNMLARAAGFRNFQHMRAAHTAGERLSAASLPENVDHKLVEKALFQFDDVGRMVRWPSRRKLQDICLWVIWSRLPAGEIMQEPEVNERLLKEHLFEDTAMLRRALISQQLATRNRDGSDYKRCELPPTAEARTLIRILEGRRVAH